ncbi:rifin [Plasmodium reichenowi]|uniref:Rifin n=1 Tax=Plasmodium reichenowi TaxID=5854 RepID=A0A060RQZ7_PLARE|nr:rifin [Plasmodium reichenowi]
MKAHYISILLFALPLNIFEHKQRNHKSSTPHKQTSRSLCECELYEPANYDNDEEMKRVMENFNKQTQQRFEEYDDRMVEKRKRCKDKCDKEIQKIILKDKLEKQMAQQLTTLETKIDTYDIPTCVCEKSLADKVEKNCMKCTQNLGGVVAPSLGVLAGIAEGALYAWKPAALDAAIAAALKANNAKILAAGIEAGNAQGMKIVSFFLRGLKIDQLFPEIYNPFVATKPYTDVTTIGNDILAKHGLNCSIGAANNKAMCTKFDIILGVENAKGQMIGPPARNSLPKVLDQAVKKGTQGAKVAAEIAEKDAAAAITEQESVLFESGFNSSISSINAAIIAIVVIILVMVIIYKILRYRRKKKMKKKLQYIKLLEE